VAAEKAGTAWPPIFEGWFGGDVNRFAQPKAIFQQCVGDMAQFFY